MNAILVFKAQANSLGGTGLIVVQRPVLRRSPGNEFQRLVETVNRFVQTPE